MIFSILLNLNEEIFSTYMRGINQPPTSVSQQSLKSTGGLMKIGP